MALSRRTPFTRRSTFNVRRVTSKTWQIKPPNRRDLGANGHVVPTQTPEKDDKAGLLGAEHHPEMVPRETTPPVIALLPAAICDHDFLCFSFGFKFRFTQPLDRAFQG